MTAERTNAITLGLFGLSVAAYWLHSVGDNKKSKKSKINDKPSNVIRPPFPQAIKTMLLRCRLAYLSTVADDAAHLSLMRFTYVNDEEDGEVIILSTQRNTKKYDHLTKQQGVAILVHDFDQFKEGSDGIHSITLNGDCRILHGEKAERYRAKHLKHNPDYPQFIVGEGIAVLCIDVKSARICNIDDRVTKWNVDQE